MDVRIVYEDNHIIVVNKPAGFLSQGDFSDRPVLTDFIKNYLKEKYNKPGNVYLGLVHRIDLEVSGLVILAKTSKAASRLSDSIRNKQIIKLYTAITPISSISKEPVKIVSNIERIKDRSFIRKKPSQNTKKAELIYQDLFSNDKYSLKLVNLISGRKHQIRAQMQDLQCPIIGDKKYNSKENFFPGAIALHSTFLAFIHPVKKKMVTFYSHNNSFDKYFPEINSNILKENIEKYFEIFINKNFAEKEQV